MSQIPEPVSQSIVLNCGSAGKCSFSVFCWQTNLAFFNQHQLYAEVRCQVVTDQHHKLAQSLCVRDKQFLEPVLKRHSVKPARLRPIVAGTFHATLSPQPTGPRDGRTCIQHKVSEHSRLPTHRT